MSAQRKFEAETINEAEFFQMAEKSVVRLEYIDGFVRGIDNYADGDTRAMAGGQPRHAILSTRFATTINNRLGQDSPCEAAVADVFVKAANNNARYLPDVVVFCEDAEFDPQRSNVLLSPLVIIEVLSASTSRIDRTEKLDAYRSVETLRHYLLVEQNQVRIEHYRRTPDGWHYEVYLWRREEIPFADLGIEVAVAEIYRRLDVPEGFVLIGEEDAA
ncbi:MAG: Uma2 family endonuclease [Armatimonadetes bacterium]|nr:Uma2 family endonuclease [Armatimonadota bacterium]